MHYDPNEQVLHLTVGELVALSRRQLCAAVTPDERETLPPEASAVLRRQYLGTSEGFPLQYDAICGERHYRITATADRLDGEELSLLFPLPSLPPELPKAVAEQTRGMAFCIAYMLSQTSTVNTPTLQLHYCDGEGTQHYVRTERPTHARLEKFFLRLLQAPEYYAAPEIDRVSNRLPTLRSLRFPYPTLRAGQEEFMQTCYRAVRGGRTLFACAPTGTGKTVSALFPAVRALGEGGCDKIFYLTPKTTTALAAADTLRLFAERGAAIRALLLPSKDRICPHHRICREEGMHCPRSLAGGRIDAAARHLLEEGHPVVDFALLEKTAEEADICPHELALQYSLYCDVIICDYNYLFDPRVYLRRYFSVKGNWCFLIDEAHNLVERARETYSGALSLGELDEFAEELPADALRDATRKAREALAGILEPPVRDSIRVTDGGKVGFSSQRELPDGLLPALLTLSEACTRCITDRPRGVPMRAVRSFRYKLDNLLAILKQYDEHYTTFVHSRDGALSFEAVCLDPSAALARRLQMGSSAVFFSATLTPVTYYRDLLGGDGRSLLLEVDSPFDRSQLCVAVLDRISTRYSMRSSTLGEIARAIALTVQARRGNYMVFGPSFAYLKALAGQYRALAPDAEVLCQHADMTGSERKAFLARFTAKEGKPLVAFCVLGGIYAEGIDLAGDALIGTIIVGVGLPQPSDRREALCSYFEDRTEMGKEYAYIYPGMNRVLQAAGRVLRREEDRGVILLIDERFAEPTYRRLIPQLWRGLKYAGDLRALEALLRRFWKDGPTGENGKG